MKSLEIIKQIKDKDANTKILVISRYKNPYLIKKAYAIGVNGFVNEDQALLAYCMP